VGARNVYAYTNGEQNWFFHHFAGKTGSALDVYGLMICGFSTQVRVCCRDKGYIGKAINGVSWIPCIGIGSYSRCQSIWFSQNISVPPQRAVTEEQLLKQPTAAAGYLFTALPILQSAVCLVQMLYRLCNACKWFDFKQLMRGKTGLNLQM
jgi:hypothetical protein